MAVIDSIEVPLTLKLSPEIDRSLRAIRKYEQLQLAVAEAYTYIFAEHQDGMLTKEQLRFLLRQALD